MPKAAGSSIQFCVALELVAGFVAVVDRLIKLLERKEAHQARLFDKFVDPLFRDLEPVAADYIKFFSETSELLDRALAEPDARSSMRAAAKRVRARREEFLFARKKVQQLARVAVTHIKDEDVKGFAMSVAWFFYGSNFPSKAVKVADLFDAVAAWRMWWPANSPFETLAP